MDRKQVIKEIKENILKKSPKTPYPSFGALTLRQLKICLEMWKK